MCRGSKFQVINTKCAFLLFIPFSVGIRRFKLLQKYLNGSSQLFPSTAVAFIAPARKRRRAYSFALLRTFFSLRAFVRHTSLYTVKYFRRFYGKIAGNQLPVYFQLFFLQAPVNIFRNQAQNGSKGHFFCQTALQSYKGIFEYCRLT